MKKKKKTKLQTHQFEKKKFKDQNTLFTVIFTGNMQTQLHKKNQTYEHKKRRKPNIKQKIERNNLNTKTHYLQGSLLAICKRNYTKKNMKNKKNTKHQTQIKRNNLKTKTHYLQGSLLAICKPNYTKQLRNMNIKKKKTKHQTQIKRNNLKTKTQYLQGSLLAICKPNYTKKT